MKQFSLSAFVAASCLLIGAGSASAGAIAGTGSGRPTTYNVTVNKVELCRSSACVAPFVLGTVTGTFDIASATAGQEVGKLIDLSGIPMYQTWTHARITVSSTFSMAADDTTCATNGTNITNRDADLTGGLANFVVSGGGGAGSLQTMVLPNQARVAALIGGFDYTTYGITQTEDASEFTMTVALSAPYTCTGEMPRIEVQFDTSEAFGYNTACNAFAFPQPPTITITATDP